MTLNSTGPISIGGATTGQSINLELGLSATTSSSLNDSSFRNLAGVASGAISLNNFYGKSNVVLWDMLLMGGGGGAVDIAYNANITGDDGNPPPYTGWYPSGGGGGGGLLTTSSSNSSGQSLFITVGAGGSGTASGGSSYYALTSGGSAVTTALGGGTGANGTKNGGSGGGGNFTGITFLSGGTGTDGQGNNGGSYNSANTCNAGGGGGKNGAGVTATGSGNPLNGGNGGTGYDLTNFRGGSSLVVAYGGGGGGYVIRLNYTSVSGTNGSTTYPNDYVGPANSGGGARGQGGLSPGINQPSRTRAGGSGIVIIRYPGSVAKATGGTTYTATVGGTAYYFHEFTASGTLTFT